MATGLPARVVLVCAVVLTGAIGHAQPPPGAAPAQDKPPVTSPTAPAPTGTPGAQPTIAQAQGRRQVAVIDLSTDPAAETLANELYNALVNHIDLRPLANPNFVRSLKGPFPAEEVEDLETAKNEKKAAEDFLINLDYGSAELAAGRGMRALHRARLSPEGLALYAELAFARGRAQLKQRKPNEASLAFGLSYRLDPAKQPDPARYEPDIVDAYRAAVTRTVVQGKLEVKGTGTVWIDGVDRGPPGVFDVAQGLHVVQLTGPERETRGDQVPVQASTTVEIEAAPASEERRVERLRFDLAQTRDDFARAGAVKKLTQLLGVGDAVLIEKAASGKLRVQTWRDVEGVGFSKWIEHDKEPPGDLLTPLAPPRVAEPVKPVKPPRPEVKELPQIPEGKPFYKKGWFYGSVAAVVLAGAIYGYIKATEPGMLGWDTDIKPVGE